MITIASRRRRVARIVPFALLGFAFALSGFIYFSDKVPGTIACFVPVFAVLPAVLPLLFLSRRLWLVAVDHEKILLSSGKKKLEISLTDILRIEVAANQSKRRENKPLTVLIFKQPVAGISRVHYLADDDKTEDELILHPWKQIQVAKAQASLKQRGAKR